MNARDLTSRTDTGSQNCIAQDSGPELLGPHFQKIVERRAQDSASLKYIQNLDDKLSVYEAMKNKIFFAGQRDSLYRR